MNRVITVLSKMFFIVFAAFAVSCSQSSFNMWTGVGIQVDDIPPEIDITSHNKGDFMGKDDFTISGKYKDNIGVTRVHVVLSADNTKQTLVSDKTYPGSKEGTWEATFEKNDLVELGLFTKGNAMVKVTFNVTAYDNLSNYAYNSVFLYVDMELPDVEWQKPDITNRFTDKEKNEFVPEQAINEANSIGKFQNGEMVLAGFVSDNFTVQSTYLKFLNVNNEIIAVTPIINNAVTADGDGFIDNNEENAPKQIGIPAINSNQMSWKFTIDTKELTESSMWVKVVISTKDGAGNPQSQSTDAPWLYICQDADTPRNIFNIDTETEDGDPINYGGMISGYAYDDDGVISVYVYATLRENDADVTGDPREWTETTTATKVVKKINASNDQLGSSLLNWGITAPEKGGKYIVYAVPIDKNGKYCTKYKDPAYKGIYYTHFTVTSEENPRITLDAKFKGATIIDDGTKHYITGTFYDNNEVKSITATLKKVNDQSVNIPVILYPDKLGSGFVVSDPTPKKLSSGQFVDEYTFTWDFDPIIFKEDGKFAGDYSYKNIELTLTAKDEESNIGQDSMTAYGDLEIPSLTGVTPENNLPLLAPTKFSGYAVDNVDIASVVISCASVLGFGEHVFKTNPTEAELAAGVIALGERESVSGTSVKYRRYFEMYISPEDINFKGVPIELRVTDKTGNEFVHTIFTKADTTKPVVQFSGIDSGSYASNSTTFTVSVSHERQEIDSISVYAGDVLLDSIDKSDFVKDANSVYSKEFAVSDLALLDGDNTIKVLATSESGNEGEGSIYFIVDNTGPTGMEITVPTLSTKSFIDSLVSMNMENISYYLNNTITFKGIGSDNYKVAETKLDIYNESSVKKYGITIGYDATGDVTFDAVQYDGSNTASWDGVTALNVGSIPSNYGFGLNTTRMADGNYYVIITSTDISGNSSSTTAEASDKCWFKVFQEADKPRISFNVNDGTTVFKGYEITGIAYDDDGFSPDYTFKYLLAKDKTDEQAMSDFNNNNDTGVMTPSNASTWSFAVPSKCDEDGNWTLIIQPIDKFGLPGDVRVWHLTASSSEMPRITSVTQETGAGGKMSSETYGGPVKINVTAYAGSDSKKVKNIAYRVYCTGVAAKDTTADISALTAANPTNKGGWYIQDVSSQNLSTVSTNVTFDTVKFRDEQGKMTVEVKTTNTDGVESTSSQTAFMVDNEKPTVRIQTPLAAATIDGMTTFSGTIKDTGSSVQKVYISYMSVTDPSTLTAGYLAANSGVPGDETKDIWLNLNEASYATTWTYEYNTTKLTDDANYTIAVCAVDELDNVGYATVDVHVSQDNDRPIVTISNMNLTGMTSSTPVTNEQGSIIGSVYDDDGTVKLIEYSLTNNGSDWSPLSSNSTSFTYDSANDGFQSFYLRITDAKDLKFTSQIDSTRVAIKLRDNNGNKFGEKGSTNDALKTVVYTRIDTKEPVMSNIKYSLDDSTYSDIDGLSSEIVGGSVDTLYVKFDASDDNGIDVAKYIFSNRDEVDVTSTKSGNTYKCTIANLNTAGTGYFTLILSANDKAGKNVTNRYQVQVDNTKPEVSITTPSGGTVDKTITVSGMANDAASSISGVYISYLPKATLTDDFINGLTYSAITGNLGDNVAGRWTQVTLNGSSWSTASYSTSVLTAAYGDDKISSYKIVVAAIDSNNNVGTAISSVDIDQDYDRPTIKLLSTKLGSDMQEGVPSWITTDSISGTVSDNDGIVKKIEIKIDDKAWVTLSEDDNSFNYNKDKGLSDGEQKIYFRITDAKEGEFVSQGGYALNSVIIEDASTPKVTYGKYSDRNDSVKKNTIIYATIDTTPPQINDEMFGDQDKIYTAISGLGGVTFGGTNKKRYLNIKFTAFDKNSIATNADTKPRVVLGNKTFLGTLKSSSDLGDVYEATIDLNGVESGNKTFYIRVKDVAAERAGTSWVEKQYTVKVDNDPPIVDFRSPNNGAIVYGSSAGNKIKGSLSDESGYSKIFVGYSKTNSVPSTWTEVQTQLGSNVSSWTMNYNAASQMAEDSGEYNWPVYKDIKDGVGATTGTGLIETIDEQQNLYVWMKATDTLGNEGTAVALNLKVLANADKPQITITYPSNESVVGGTIRITGTTQIEDSAVDSVWIQIDPDYGDTPFSDGDGWKTRLNALIDGKDVGYSIGDRTTDTGIVEGIRATGNVASWGLPINAMKEFNQDSGNRKVAIRAIAVEEKRGKNTTSDIITFEVDKNSPVFGDRETIILKNGDKQKVYADGVWVDDANNKWRITGSIEDDTGIDKLIMTRTVNGSEQTPVTLILDGEPQSSYTDWFTSIGEPQTGFHNWRMNIPVDRGSRKYGTVIYELEAFENSLDKKSSKAKYTINFDSQAPEFSLIGLTDNGNSITNRILNGDDMFYSMNGQMSEVGDSTANQSGFSRIAMFFTRTIGGRTYIIDPMLDKGSDGHANRIDVSTLSAGTKIHGLYCHTISGVSLSNNTMLTLPEGTTPRSKNIRPGGLCIVNDVVYRITNVSGQVVTVGSSLGSTASGLTVYFPVAQVIDNTSTEAGSMNDVFRYNDSGDPEGDSLVNRDYDQMLEGVDTSGATYTWTVTINSKNIYDGVVKVCFVAFDKAGNFTEKLVEATVKNNPPRLAGIVFGSDINGDEDVTTDETNTDFSGLYDVVGLHKASGVVMNGWYPNNGGLVDGIDVPATLDETLLTIKRKAFLRPEIVGGNGGLIWTIHVDGGNDVSGDFGVMGSYDDTVRKLNIPLEGETLDKMGIETLDDAIVTLEITDKTEGGGTSAEYKIRANLILSDTEKPHIALKKFYWEDKSKSSVYTDADGNLLGHIELTDDLPDTLFKSSNKGVVGKEEYDLDTKVSGIIIFDGTADDNSVVQQIKVQIPKFKTVEVDRGSGDFALNHTAGDLSNDGWMFRVIDDDFDKHTGANTVVWKFYWDTNKITNHADKDIELVFDAFDKGDLKSEKSAKCRVDVVPYITKVTTGLSALKSGNPSVYNRTALGHYPVADSEDKIKFEGFNLTGGTITFAGTSDNTTDYNAAGIAVPSGAKSGAAFITVNGMKSLNNDNKNDAKGSYSKTVNLISKPSGDATVYGNYYNRQPNGETNNLLVDDVIFDIWQFKDAGISQSSGYITEPIMKINPKNGILNFGFNSGPANYCMANGQSTSYTTWVGNYARFSTCGFTVDENGNTHGITVGLDTNPSSGSAGRMQYFTSKWGTSDLGTNGNYEGKNSSRFENIGAPAGTYNGVVFDSTVFIEDRFASPSLATVVHGTDTYVFLAYFDDLNGQIRFKWGNLSNAYYDTKTTNTTVTGKQAITFNQFMDYRKATGLANNSHAAFDSNQKPENFSTIAGTGFPTKAGTYVSIDVIKGAAAANDVIVATWYDSTESKWYYSYKVNPCNDNDMAASPSATPTSGNWRKPVELAANAGENCQIMVDAKGHIHIAAYDTVNADLKYAYLKSYNSNTFKVVTVDSYAFTGTNIRLDTAISADGNYIVPYIGYYMSSTQRPKIAYLDKVIPVATGEADIPSGTDTSELFIGKWESSIVPTPSRFADNYAYSYVNVGVWKDEDGKITTSQTGTESYDNQSGLDKSNKGYAYGNGTMNPIMGYATRVGTRGHLETAQMK